MDFKSLNNVHERKTIWTIEMDRYFIDLMLEQLNKGTRSENRLFDKRAWNEMTSLFNVRFKSMYHTDILKSRYRYMKNVHETVKSILDHEGFSWDELHHKVAADDIVWEEYLESHPEERKYKMKEIYYFDDLTIIFQNKSPQQKDNGLPERERYEAGNAGTEEAANGSAECEVEGNNMDKITGPNDTSQAMEKRNRTRTTWKPPMDRYFIELLLEQIRKGNHMKCQFRWEVWEEMTGMFNAKFGLNHGVAILKNHYKTLQRLFCLIKNLLETEGFAWDDTRQMVTAEDTTWEKYIKIHGAARKFMKTPIPHYKDLCVIFCHSSPRKTDCFDKEDLEEHNGCHPKDFHHVATKQPTTVDITPSTISPKNKRQSENLSDSESSNKSQRTEEMRIQNLDNQKDSDSDPLSVEKVVAAIQSLPDMDGDLILDACDFLEDESKAEAFMALNVRLRKKWLLKKLRPRSS